MITDSGRADQTWKYEDDSHHYFEFKSFASIFNIIIDAALCNVAIVVVVGGRGAGGG